MPAPLIHLPLLLPVSDQLHKSLGRRRHFEDGSLGRESREGKSEKMI